MQKLEASFISELIEQVLDRIEKRLSTVLEKELTEGEFAELHCVFSEQVLYKAFHLVDTHLIVSYRPESGISELIEITGEWSSPEVYKIFPNINFCHCKFFTEDVLLANKKCSYTCEHVLAARLARILDKLQVEVLPKHKFDFIFKQIAAE